MSGNNSADTPAVDMDRGSAASGADAFDATTGASMAWEGKRPEELAALPEDQLSSMSHEDIEKAFGLDIPDRTRMAHPTGDMTVEQADRALEAGEISVPTEEMLAAAALAVLSPNKGEGDGKGEEKPESGAATTTTTDKAAADEEGKTTETPPDTTTDDEKPVVAARDGKGVIPYEVLESSRRRAAELEAELAELRGERQRKEEQDRILSGLLTEEQIEELKNEFPEAIVNTLVAQQNTIRELAQKITAQPGSGDTLTEEQKAAQQVQDLIDQDPILSKWQNDKDGTNWDRAVRFDRALLEDPVWQTKPPRERFDEVIRLMGENPRGSSATGGLPSAQQVAAAAEAAEAAAHASAGRRAPTHSDLPGGAPPAQSEQSRLEALTPTQLEAMFEGGVEIDALLAKLG